LVRNSQH